MLTLFSLDVSKDHICATRPALLDTIEEVSTGEAWLAVEGKKKGLVDEIMTSDEFFADMCKTHDVIHIKPKPKHRFPVDDFFDLAVKVKNKILAPVAPTARAESMMM